MSDFYLHGLFPVPVGYNKLAREFTEEELVFIRNLERLKNEGNYSSLNNYLLNSPELSNLKADIQVFIDEYFQIVHKPVNDVQLVITQSWANFTKPNEFHHVHHHGNSFVSGVIYIKTNPANTDQIRFHSPKKDVLLIDRAEWTMSNSESWRFSAVERSLFLFPSDLQHDVPPVEGSDERISIAFNTFFNGRLGNADAKTELYVRSNA